MKNSFSFFTVMILSFLIYFPACSGQKIQVSSFCESLTPVGRILEDSTWTKWAAPEIAYQTNEFYFKEPVKRMEHPNILWKDDKPAYLFLALEEGKYGLGSGVVLKIGEWK